MITASFSEYTASAAGAAGEPVRAAGTIVPYGIPGDTSAGPLVVAAGALVWPEDLSRVKLFHGHDRDTPIGYLEAVEASDEGLAGIFVIGDTAAGRTAADELRARVRDGFSVELHDAAVDDTTDPPTIRSARLTGVGLVPVPAYAGALAVAAADRGAVSDTPAGRLTMNDTATTETAAPVTAADAPATIPAPPAAERITAAARTAPVSAAAELAGRIHGAYRDGGPAASAAVITAALADVTPAGNGAGNDLAGLAVQAAGELGGMAPPPVYDAIVTGRQLTGMKVYGWRWAVPPEVADYAGNKAEIPTNPAKLEYVETGVSRLAGGHDMDRVYVDLGGRDVIVSYWRRMAESLAVQLDSARLAAVQSAGGSTGSSGDVATAISAGLRAVPGANYVVVAEDLYSAMAAQPAADLPAILSGEGLFGTGMPPTFINGVGLTGKVIVGKRSAVEFYTLSPEIRLEAVNIPHAGVDAGMYSYYASLAGDPSGVYIDTVAAAAAETRTARGK